MRGVLSSVGAFPTMVGAQAEALECVVAIRRKLGLRALIALASGISTCDGTVLAFRIGMRGPLLLLLPATFLIACAVEPDEEIDGVDETVVSDGKGDGGIARYSYEGLTAVRVANMATRDELLKAGLAQKVADGIIAMREREGIVVLEDLDDVPYVGPIAINRLVTWGEQHGLAVDRRMLFDLIFALDIPAIPRVDATFYLWPMLTDLTYVANIGHYNNAGQRVENTWTYGLQITAEQTANDVQFDLTYPEGGEFALGAYTVTTVRARGSWRDSIHAACGRATLYFANGSTAETRWIVAATYAPDEPPPPFCP
jgi:hypothetical protein